jgi:hypothetical protein
VFLDAESALNLIYAKTLQAVNISLTNLTPSDDAFHGVIPGKPETSLENIWLDGLRGQGKLQKR